MESIFDYYEVINLFSQTKALKNVINKIKNKSTKLSNERPKIICYSYKKN